jgi:23S rRNA (cytosine1962-C5)-methyltransferase
VITIETASDWGEYELLDSGLGRRLERFGKFILDRPDPQALWQPTRPENDWQKTQAVFDEHLGRGRWTNRGGVPEKWILELNGLKIFAKLSPFKHVGVFPEQVSQWKWIEEKIKEGKSREQQIKVLNLFAYTGVASLVAAKVGAMVTHVDASRPTIGWARENQAASGMNEAPIRWILDDCLKFCEREVKRGVKYDAVIMDPPVYGHGPDGRAWDFTRDFPKLLSVVAEILSSNPLFILINAYAVSASSIMLGNMLAGLKLPGKIEYGELALKESSSERLLSTGIFGRWQTN